MARLVVAFPKHYHLLLMQHPGRLQAQSLSGMIQDKTGHSGSLLVVHLNNTADACTRCPFAVSRVPRSARSMLPRLSGQPLVSSLPLFAGALGHRMWDGHQAQIALDSQSSCSRGPQLRLAGDPSCGNTSGKENL
jgi:hypothetical protein